MATKNATGYNAEKYGMQTAPYAAAIKAIFNGEKEVLDSLEPDGADPALKKFALAGEMLNAVSNYIVINGISKAVMNSKDEEALNNARKSLYKSIIYLEDVVTGYVDAPYSDYKDRLEAIESIPPADRYILLRKMGLVIDLVASAYADCGRWAL